MNCVLWLKGDNVVKDFLDMLKSMETSTLVIMGFAAVLLIFLLVLIIITIKALKSSNFEDEDAEDKKKEKLEKLKEEIEEDDDLDDDDEDDMSRKVREVVESVKETQAKAEAQKISEVAADEAAEEVKAEEDVARKNAAARVRKIAAQVAAGESGDDEDGDDYDDSYEDEDRDEAESESVSEEADVDVQDNLSDDYMDDDFDGPDPDVGNITDELDLKSSSNKEMTEEVATAKTAVVDTKKIKEELRKARKEAKESEKNPNEMAKERAEAPEYNASFDSAFVDKPAYEEKKEPLIPNPTPESMLSGEAAADSAIAAGIAIAESAAAEADAAPAKTFQNKITVNPVNAIETTSKENIEQVKEFLEENPTPAPASKKKKNKKKGKGVSERPVAPIKTSKYFWYNTQDIEGLTRKEDMYFKCHYFDNGDDIVLDLITEMYDCAFVRTEELQRIAYGITFKSLGMKEILRSEENLGFDHDKATKEPTESDKQEAFDKWCQYVDNFLEIIEINAPDEVKDYIIDKMYEYGHKDIEDLMYSPY